MDREDLHGPGLGLVLTGREAVALLRLGEPSEEGAERRVLGDVGEPGEQLVERLEAGRAERLRRVRGHLDVEQQLLLDEVHEVDQPESGTAAEGLQLGARAAHPAEADLGELAERGMPVGRGEQEVECVDDRRGLVGRDRGAQPLPHVVVEPPAAEVAVGQPPRQPVERGQVGGADAPSCAAEHPHELGAGGGVVQRPQHADEVGDHRLVEQAGDAEHVHRHAVRAQCLGEDADVREGAAEQRAAASGAIARGAEPRGEPAGDELGLLLDRLGPGGLDASGAGERSGGRAAPSGSPRRGAR